MLARALGNRGVLYLLQGDLAAAAEMNTLALSHIETLLTMRPTSTLLRKDKAAIVGEIGKDRLGLGSLRQAEVDLKESRRIIDKIVEENPEVIEYRNTQGETYLYLGTGENSTSCRDCLREEATLAESQNGQ